MYSFKEGELQALVDMQSELNAVVNEYKSHPNTVVVRMMLENKLSEVMSRFYMKGYGSHRVSAVVYGQGDEVTIKWKRYWSDKEFANIAEALYQEGQ